MPERVLNFRALFLHGLYKMDKPKAYCRLLLPCFLLLSACTVDISQPDSSATAVNAEAKTWAVKFQHQSSFTEQSIKEITEPDLKPGDLLFSSSLGVTSFGIRVFSTSSVSHVAIYLGNNNVAEATGAGVQIVSLKKAMKHSDKLFVLRVPALTPQQATEITAFANKIKDSGYNYRGIVEFIPFMVTRQMCSLNPFSEDFRQQCVSGLAKAQLSNVGEGDKKSWFCSEFVTDAFAKCISCSMPQKQPPARYMTFSVVSIYMLPSPDISEGCPVISFSSVFCGIFFCPAAQPLSSSAAVSRSGNTLRYMVYPPF